MHDIIISLLGFFDIVGFFATDLYYAYHLSVLQEKLPQTPENGLYMDAHNPNTNAIDLGYAENQDGTRFSGDPVGRALEKAKSGVGKMFSAFRPQSNSLAQYENLDRDVIPGVTSMQNQVEQVEEQKKIFYILAVVSGALAPLIAILQLLWPETFGWTVINIPLFLSYIVLIPGGVMVGFYVRKAANLKQYIDITRTHWLKLAWFRLDIICGMIIVLFVGWGAWVVSLCMLCMALFIVNRLLSTEKKMEQLAARNYLIHRELEKEVNHSIYAEHKKKAKTKKTGENTLQSL